MKRRLISLLLCAAMLLTLIPQVSAAGVYVPANAIAWATDKTAFNDYTGKCASFVSACLRKGGLTDVKKSVVGELLDYIVAKGYGTVVEATDANLKKLKAGDAIAVACPKKHSGYGKHIIFVTAVDQSNKKITFCAKNTDRFKESYSFATVKKYHTYFNSGKCSGCSTAMKTYLVLMNATTTTTQRYYSNYSGKNYLMQSDFSGTLNESNYFSRDTAVSTVSIDPNTTHDGYQSLKIVNKSAGSSSADLSIRTTTNASRKEGVYYGDSKKMTLSFWAKSSVAGNTFNFRWGYESEFTTVKLTTDWAFYSMDMSKTTDYTDVLHPYIGKAGTVWVTQMQLEDGTEATEFVPEPQGLYATTTSTIGKTYTLPEDPVREGYTFDGWYTAVSGGTRIDATTATGQYSQWFYAHWTPKAHTHSYQVTEVVPVTCTSNGYTIYTCACGDSYMYVDAAALGHDWDEGTEVKAATEEETGLMRYSCKRCSEFWEETIPVLPHTHRYTKQVVAPSCTEDGYTAYSCYCGEYYVEAETLALGHSWDAGVVTRPATEAQPGEVLYTCTRCTETKTAELSVLPHTHRYTAKVIAPTCTKEGYTEYTCTCGDTYRDNLTKALGHSWDNGTVTRAATEEKAGEKRYTCTRCYESRAETIPALSHEKSCPGRAFTDMPKYGNWAHNGIDYCIENGLMNGVSKTLFQPGGNVTRAQLVTILYRVEGSPKVDAPADFTDVPTGKWYSDAIAWAAANGIVNGTGAGKFNPTGNITREQIATILYRYSGSAGTDRTLADFPDSGKVSSYAVTAMAWATEKGFINGVASNGVTNLAPKNNATRAQIASIIMRFINAQEEIDVHGHTYKFVIGTYSWTEAQAIARQDGGYLVNFDTQEEYEYVLSEITRNHLNEVYFMIGGRRDLNSKEYYWVDANDQKIGTPLNAQDAWCADYWLKDEPTFVWNGTNECYMQMYYAKSYNRWALNDIREKPTTPTNPECRGFIVEYD